MTAAVIWLLCNTITTYSMACGMLYGKITALCCGGIR